MLEALIRLSLRHPQALWLATAALLVAGIASALRIPMDAVPDITSPQIQINTEVSALAPEEIEALVTRPLEQELTGLPQLVELRSLSKFGLSQVTLVLEDGVDLARHRQWVSERLNRARSLLPEGINPILAPVSTGLGEIVYYHLGYKSDSTSAPADLTERLQTLRQIHEVQVKPLLRGTPGLAEVNAIGGYERQVVIEPRPEALAAAGLSFSELVEAIRRSTTNAGGGVLELGGEAVIVRANTRAQSLEDLRTLPLKFAAGEAPLRVQDVADVALGTAFRTGAATANGEETVTGVALMLAGENARVVARAVVTRLEQIQTQLPAGVEITVVYDRSDLVQATLHTVRTSLWEGAILVGVVLFFMLGNSRAALIVASAIPLSFLFMVTGLAQTEVSANLMSLGAIDFGLIVDGAIVMVENILRRLTDAQKKKGQRLGDDDRTAVVHSAAIEVARPMFFGVLIITLVYIPIFALTGIEGKMFRPMALAVVLALLGALALSLTLMPVLCSRFLRGDFAEDEGRGVTALKRLYSALLTAALRGRAWVVLGAAFLVVGAGALFFRLGAEFLPQLDEGSLALQMVRGNSVSLRESIALQKATERHLQENFPEVAEIFARLGTAEIATDPMGPNIADTYLSLHPRETWRKRDGRVVSKAELVEEMRRSLLVTIPGQTYSFSQPIQMRFNEIMAGARADLSLKLFGEDYATLERLAEESREVLRRIRGGEDVEFEALGRVPTLEITPKREALARVNLHANELNDTVSTALGGAEVGTLPLAQPPLPIQVRLPEAARLDVAGLGRLAVRGEEGQQVPLAQIANFEVVDRVGTLNREDTQRRVALLINVRGRDTEGFVQEAQRTLTNQVKFPEGYRWEFGGQFENLRSARERLAVVVPVGLGLILLLLRASLGQWCHAALVFVCVPLAGTGGVLALWIREMPFTLSAAVGFIALSGIAVLNGLMLVTYINQLRREGRPVRTAVLEGTLTRLRPKLLTALVASLGFVPMALSTGPGAEVQSPLATVVIGGVLTSTFLTLIVLPVLYDWLEHRRPTRPTLDTASPSSNL